MKAEELVEIIGYRNTNKLLLMYGGRSIHIPKRAKKEHKLALLIGFDNLEKLCDQYPTELLFVPRVNLILNDFRQYFDKQKPEHAENN
jgi:hypothetical protein